MNACQKLNNCKSNLILVAGFVMLIGFVLPAMALSPEMEADLLLISATKHTDRGDHSAAAKDFKKILALKIKLPTEFYYHYGRHFYLIGRLKEAKNNIETYLKKAGRKGQFYRDSLQVLIAINEKQKKPLSRFVDNDDGTVTDNKTGLIWADADNGRNINWKNAKIYCEKYRGGGYVDWRMPTQDELASLHDRKEKNSHGYQINKLIDLTACCPWGSETKGSGGANFSFLHGYRFWYIQSFSLGGRALPVRGPN